jgi:hypothetical protein
MHRIKAHARRAIKVEIDAGIVAVGSIVRSRCAAVGITATDAIERRERQRRVEVQGESATGPMSCCDVFHQSSHSCIRDNAAYGYIHVHRPEANRYIRGRIPRSADCAIVLSIGSHAEKEGMFLDLLQCRSPLWIDVQELKGINTCRGELVVKTYLVKQVSGNSIVDNFVNIAVKLLPLASRPTFVVHFFHV